MKRIALIGENSQEYVKTLLDIRNNGDCAVLIDWRIPFYEAVRSGVCKCYIERKYLAQTNSENIEFIAFKRKIYLAELLPSEIRSKFKANYSRKEAVILYSSGTTGRAKGVILSHYAINTNADAILDYMRLSRNDCVYIAKPLSHSSTITGELLTSLKSGAMLVIAPTVVPPRFALNNIEKYGVTTICLNPSLLKMYGAVALSPPKKRPGYPKRIARLLLSWYN